MSGKVNKSAAGKTGTTSEKKDDKATKDTPVPEKPAPVAPVITDDSQTSQSAVAASDVASDPEPVPGDNGITVIPATVSVITIPGEKTGDDLRNHIWQETLAHDHSEAFRIAENVVVLEVRAIPENGFHRAGRFWPHDTVHVFVSDNPDEQILEDAGGKPLQGCVISTDTALRLKAEKMLIVTELVTVSGAEADVESK